jgi:predicted PolB exonuclease-like 3'-5' exonuclease
MTPILVFDIETIPDAAGLRKIWDLAPAVSDAAVVELASQRRRQATGNDFLAAHVQRVVAISCALRRSVPLNTMCSRRCDTPMISRDS